MLSRTRFSALAGILTASALLAGNAYTRDSVDVVIYTCPGGERFSVEFQRDHVRLRTGAGIFALPRLHANGPARYSDGQTVFSTDGTTSALERNGMEAERDCRQVARKS